MPSRLVMLFLSLGAICVVGCQQKTSVSGAVTYNGEPVEDGAISFRPAGGTGQSFGVAIENGRYAAPNAKPGSFTAVVIGVKKINFALSSGEAAKQADQLNAASGHLAGQVSDAADYIPEDAAGNGQTVEIASGEQMLDFTITGPPRN